MKKLRVCLIIISLAINTGHVILGLIKSKVLSCELSSLGFSFIFFKVVNNIYIPGTQTQDHL